MKTKHNHGFKNIVSFIDTVKCSSFKYIIFKQIIALTFIFFCTTLHAATYYSIATGNWNTNTTWSLTSGGTAVGSGIYPKVTDNVIIESGFTVSTSGNSACASLQVNNGTMTYGTGSATTDTIAGNLTIGASGIINGFTHGASQIQLHTLYIGGNISCSGSLSADGKGKKDNIKVYLNGTTQTISGTGTFTWNSLVINSGSTTTVTSSSAQQINVDLTIAGTLDFGTTNFNRATTGGTLTVSGKMILGSNTGGQTGSNFPLNFTTMTLTGSTIVYNFAGAQTVYSSPVYTNLTLSGSGVKTLTSATVNGILSMEGTATATGTPNYASTATLQYKGTASIATSNNEFPAGFQGSGGIIIDQGVGNTVTLNANKTAINGNLNIKSGTFDLSTFTANRATAGGTLTVAAGATLKIGGTNTLPSNYTTHSINCSSTIDYSGTNQTVANLNSAQTYGNLTLSGSGTKTLQTGTTSICSNFTITGTANTTGVVGLTIGGNVFIDVNALFTAGSFTHNVTGNWTKSGTFTATGSTINFNSSSAAQSIGASNFNHITFTGAGTKTATGILTIAGNVTISSNFTAGNYNHSVAGTWTNNGTFTAGNGTITMSATTAKTIGGSADSQFYNLTFNETGSSALGINTSVSGTLTMTQGLVDIGTYTFTVAGVSGGSSGSYVKTSSSGRLKRLVATGGTVYSFPVGNSAYNPISFSSSATGNGNSDYFSVRVEDGAITTANVNAKTVNRKWYLMSATTGITSLTVTPQYNAGETGASFNAASSPKVGFFTGTAWGYSPTATAAGTGPFTITASGTAPDASSASAFVALGSEDAFNASKLSITVLPPTPYRGINSSVATVQSQNSQNVPTWVIQSTYFDLTSNKSFTRAGGLTGFAIAAGTHETIINNIQFLVSTWNVTTEVYDVNATVTASRTSGENLSNGVTPNFAIKEGSIYRPTTNGNWSTVQWEISGDGGNSWTNTNLPTNSVFAENDVIQIPTNITLTANTNASFYSLVVFGTLDISSSVTLTLNHSTDDLGDYNISIYGTLKNSGGTITNSNAAYTPMYLYGGTYWHSRNGGIIPAGNWNSLNGTASTCKVTGISSTAITSGLEQNYQNLIWDNASQSVTQTLSADLTVRNTLTLSNGVITTSTNKVIIELGGTSVSTNNSRINGNIRIHIPTTSSPTINFPIGDANYYTPLSVAFTGTIVGSGYLDAYTNAAQPGLATGLSQTKYINRIWSVSNTNISGFSSFNTTFTFADADKVGSPNTSALVVRKRDNNIWAVTTTGTRTANTTECTNMTTFSDFSIGEDDCTSTNYVWLGGTSTDWNTASNWCYNQVPGATVDVTIPAGPVNQPIIGASATCKNLSIANGASLTISGTNTLSVKGNLTNSGTFTANTSTVSCTGSSAQTLTGSLNFYNLTINNTAGVIAANDLTVNGTLNLQSANANATTGALNMDSYTLNMGTDALTTGTGDVTGIIKREQTFVGNTTYTFGNANTTISFTNVPGATKPAWISCKLTLGTAPGWRSQAIKRVYSFAQDGTGNDRTVVHLHYLDSELHDSETDETKLVFWDAYTGPAFSNTFPRSKSNFDATNNWIGLAGMAINFFAPSSTLDYKQWGLGYTNVTKIIWTGNGSPTYSGDWSLPGNWNGGVPTANDDVLIPATLPGDTHGYPTRNLNQGTTPAVANSIEIEAGATLTVDNYPISIYGSTGAWINSGTFVPGSGNVTFAHNNQSEVITLGGTTNFHNLTFGANTVMRPNNGTYIGITGSLTLDGSSILEFTSSNNTVEFKGENQTIPNPTGLGLLRGYYNLTLSSSGTATLSDQLNVSGNLTLNSNINGTTNNTTLVFDGTTAQTISGTIAPTFTNLTVNNAAGIIGSTNMTISGVLTFISDNPSSNDKGALAMATDKILDLGANSSISGPGDVSGIVRRTHTFNTGTFYSFGNENNGVIFAAVSGYPGQTLPTSVSLKTNIGTASNWSGYLGATLPTSINRNWELIQTGGSGTRALMRVHYRDSEIPTGITENNLTIWTSSWVSAYNNFYNKESGRSNYNTDQNYIAIQDVDFAIIPSSWGNFKATLAASTTSNYTWIGTISTDWNNPSNWTPNSVPDATHGAIIPNTYTTPYAPTLPASATCKSVQLNAGAILNAAASGGTLTITGANAAWSAETGAVFNANTSEVIFSANALSAGDVSMAGTTNFYNLTVSSGTLLRPAGNCYTRIAGSLTNNGTLAAATNENYIEFNGSSTQSIPNPNGSTPGYHNLILSGSGTKNLPATLNITDEFINNTAASNTVSAGSGTVFFNGNAVYGQAISGTTNTTFNNVTFDNPAYPIAVETDIAINGTLNITTGSVVDMKSNVLSGTLSTISGLGTIKTQNTSSTPIPVSKTWSGLIDYNGTVAQTVVAGTYTNLTVENIAGVTAGGNLTVNGILNLAANNPATTKGLFDTDAYTLSMGAINTLAATTTGAGDVTGIVKRAHTFEGNTVYSFGNQYTSITFMNFPNTTKPGWVSCKISIGTVPTWRGVAVRRYYSFAKDAGSDRTVLKLHYLDSELNTETTEPFEPNEGKLELWDAHNGPTWSPVEVHGKSANDATANWVGLAGMSIGYITSSSELDNKQWGLSYSNVTKKTWTGHGFDTHDWALPGNWDGGIPTATDPVLIPAGLSNYPTKNLDPATYPVTIKSLEIEQGASMAVDTCTITIKGSTGAWINNGTFTAGTGKVVFANDTITKIVTIAGSTNFNNLQVKGNTYILPATNSYMGISGAITSDEASILDFTTNTNTVEFKGTDQSIVNLVGPSTDRGYHNLIISGSGTKTLPATLNIAGDFTNNGTVACGTGTVIIKDQGHVQNIGGSTTTSFYNLTIDNTDQIANATADFNVGNILTINSGTALEMNTFKLGGNLSATSGTGTLRTQNTSSTPIPAGLSWTFGVLMNNQTTAQSIPAGTYTSLQNSNPVLLTATGAINSSNLTLDNGSTLDMASYALSGCNSISGTGTLKTQNTSSTPIPSGKTWPGNVIYNGTSAQTGIAGTFGNISIENTAGVTLASNANINVGGYLVINSSKKLIIPTETAVSAQTITNNAGTSGITVKAGQTAPNGSLIFNNQNTNPVYATVEMYTKAAATTYNPTTKAYSGYKWEFFGVPLESVVADPTFYGSFVRRHYESGTSSSTLWVSQTNSSVLVPFAGYEITQPIAKTITFTGKLVNSDFTERVTVTTGAMYPGQHIYGNPYTSAIDITKIRFGSDMDSSVYIYNTGSYADWTSQNSSGDNPGQYTAVPKNTAGIGGIQGQIPSMQGFLVAANNNSSNATITIPYSAVATKNSYLQKVSSSNSATQIYTRIDVTGTRYTDKMWIITNPACTHGYNNGWDGVKFLGSSLAPQLWAMETAGDYQVDGVDNINNTFIAFMKGENSSYTMTFTHEASTTAYGSLYLVDLIDNKTVDISTSGTKYTFSTSTSGIPTSARFKITTNPGMTTNSQSPTVDPDFYNAGKTLFINNITNDNAEMVIFDIAGRSIGSYNIGVGKSSIQTGLMSGTYVVKLKTTRNIISKQIVIN